MCHGHSRWHKVVFYYYNALTSEWVKWRANRRTWRTARHVKTYVTARRLLSYLYLFPAFWFTWGWGLAAVCRYRSTKHQVPLCAPVAYIRPTVSFKRCFPINPWKCCFLINWVPKISHLKIPECVSTVVMRPQTHWAVIGESHIQIPFDSNLKSCREPHWGKEVGTRWCWD